MKKLFELEWDKKNLGKGWMNIFNLELCLFGKEHAKKGLVRVNEITKQNYIRKEELSVDKILSIINHFYLMHKKYHSRVDLAKALSKRIGR